MKLRIRPLKIDEIDQEVVSWYQNSDGHLNFFTGSRRSFSESDIVNWVSESKKLNTHFYMIEADNGDRIGTIKIGPIDTVNKTSDLVCLIGNRAYLGRGLARKAILLGNAEAFETLGIRRLHGGMFANNIPSIKAYTRANWVIEGTLKGYYLVDGKPMDRVCVACFNPEFQQEEN